MSKGVAAPEHGILQGKANCGVTSPFVRLVRYVTGAMPGSSWFPVPVAAPPPRASCLPGLSLRSRKTRTTRGAEQARWRSAWNHHAYHARYVPSLSFESTRPCSPCAGRPLRRAEEPHTTACRGQPSLANSLRCRRNCSRSWAGALPCTAGGTLQALPGRLVFERTIWLKAPPRAVPTQQATACNQTR